MVGQFRAFINYINEVKGAENEVINERKLLL